MTLQDMPLPRWRFVLPALAAFVALYAGVLHPWLMNWGATQVEVAAALPGDELAPSGSTFFTRGITINAPPSAVWPWILQIGQDRAGFYSYTWLENMTGANIHNAGRVHPEWQARAIGDHVPMARPDLLGGRLKDVSHTEIVALEPERMIANTPGRFVLRPGEGNTMRLLVRESFDSQGPAVTRWLAWDPVHFVMVQRMLRGVKERAEGRSLVPAWMTPAARLGWVLAGAGVLASFLARRRWWPWLSLPMAAALPALYGAGDGDAALAAIVAVGITAIGALAFGRRWGAAYTLLAASVLLVLLLAPEAYVAFGVTFVFAALALAVPLLAKILRKEQAAETRQVDVAAFKEGPGAPSRALAEEKLVMLSVKQAAAEFLAQKRVAVTGVSRDPHGHGSNAVYQRLRQRGYQVFPVNPNADEVEGDRCFHDLRSIPGGVDAVVIATRPEAAEATVRECADLGVKHVWMHRAFGRGSVSRAAADWGREHGLRVIDGGCPLMFEPTADPGHKVMRLVLTVTGNVPSRVS